MGVGRSLRVSILQRRVSGVHLGGRFFSPLWTDGVVSAVLTRSEGIGLSQRRMGRSISGRWVGGFRR